MKTFRLFLLASCMLVAIRDARATTVLPPTFDQLVGAAELILQSTVVDVKSQWTGEGAQRHIITFVVLKVDEKIKGEAGASYTLRLLGGTVDGVTMEVTDSPKFVVGDRDILFVENNGTQFVPLVGIMYGRFRLQQDNQAGGDLVVDDRGEPVTDTAKLGKDLGMTPLPAASERALKATQFKAAIKAKLLPAVR